MSARNYLSAREKNISKLIDCLPQINQQKFVYRTGKELPPLSASTNNFVNRNVSHPFSIDSFTTDSFERAGTPFSDFLSESETETPDFRSEESDSSAGSALQRNTAEASKSLAAEWERIERTLYDEDGEKCTRPQILEECKQWRQLHPQLRIVGKAISLPERRLGYRQIEHDEVIAMHYSNYEEFSESEERLSQSSTDVTPQNSPRVSAENLVEPRLTREKVSFSTKNCEEHYLADTFCSLLQITPIQIRSPLHRKRQNPAILRSEIASSRWMRSSRPESSVHCDRNSAKSFVSLDTRNYGNLALSASNRDKNGRVLTARHMEVARLEPLYTPDLPQYELNAVTNSSPSYYNCKEKERHYRKVSLPPLLLEEEKKKVVSVSSAKKNVKSRRFFSKGYQWDRVKYN